MRRCRRNKVVVFRRERRGLVGLGGGRRHVVERGGIAVCAFLPECLDRRLHDEPAKVVAESCEGRGGVEGLLSLCGNHQARHTEALGHVCVSLVVRFVLVEVREGAASSSSLGGHFAVVGVVLAWGEALLGEIDRLVEVRGHGRA